MSRAMGLVVCLLLAIVGTAVANYPNPITDDELTSPVTSSIDGTFYKYAQEVNTDKTWDHSYHYIYSKYLAAVRREPLRLLEIGLGCNMGYGAGHSLALWKRYLTNSKVSFVEYDAECARKHKADIEATAKGKLYIGDQENEDLLNEILRDSKEFHGYDVIIDDGGHTASQMLTSIKTLWHALKPGGVYVVEDISENYIEKPFRDPGTFIAFMKNAIDIVQCRMKPYYMGADSPVRHEFKEFCAANPMDIISVECMPEACVLIKGKPRTRGMPAALPKEVREPSSGGRERGESSKEGREHRESTKEGKEGGSHRKEAQDSHHRHHSTLG